MGSITVDKFDQLMTQLYTLGQKGGRLGLDRMERALNGRQPSFRSVHIAGTNGKGSVAIKVAAGLEEAGFSVGLYTSPHISTFRERIQINGAYIEKEFACNKLEECFAEHKDLTFFEYLTLLSFAYFEEKKVDWAVIETGLGGRFDATNVIYPELSIITNCSLDHTQLLGDTIEAITREKAGIVKEGVPSIIGPSVKGSLLPHVSHQVVGPFSHFEEENRAIAEAALSFLGIPEKEREEGVNKVPPCRFEKVYTKDIILDVAHNEDAIEKLLSRVEKEYPGKKLCVVYAASKDKDYLSCLNKLKEKSAYVFCIEAMNNPRAASVDELEKAFGAHSERVSFYKKMEEGLSQAEKRACKENALLLICGTFFIMKDVKEYFGFSQEVDKHLLNEQGGIRNV